MQAIFLSSNNQNIQTNKHNKKNYYYIILTKIIANIYLCVCVKVVQWCPTLCDPLDCNLPGFSVYGILQARILEWVAVPFSGRIFPTQGSNPSLLHCRQILYQLGYQGQHLLSVRYGSQSFCYIFSFLFHRKPLSLVILLFIFYK